MNRDTLMDTARISMWAGQGGPGLKMKLVWVWPDSSDHLNLLADLTDTAPRPCWYRRQAGPTQDPG